MPQPDEPGPKQSKPMPQTHGLHVFRKQLSRSEVGEKNGSTHSHLTINQKLPIRLTLRCRRDAMDAQICTIVFLLLVEAQAAEYFKRTINQCATDKGDDNRQNCHDQLWHKGNSPCTTERLAAKNTCGNSPHAPHSPCSGQTPSTSSIFQRFWVSVNI